MSLSSVDERSLLLPLLEGAREDMPWQTFLRLLAQRTGAARALLLMRPVGASIIPPGLWQATRPARADLPPLDIGPLERNGILPISVLRPGRVYALAELIDPPAAAGADDLLAAHHLADARIIRLRAGPEIDAWLMLADDRPGLGAADSALLAALAPFIAHAISAEAARLMLEAQVVQAGQLMARLGINAMMIDAQGRPLQPFTSATRASVEWAGRRAESADAQVQQGREGEPALLVAPAPPHGSAWVATVMWRSPPADQSGAAIAALMAQWRLSRQEAALAWAIASGEPLIEAGLRLGLTRETTRNYSKRIYAKTGTSGQADLARLCHQSLAPLME